MHFIRGLVDKPVNISWFTNSAVVISYAAWSNSGKRMRNLGMRLCPGPCPGHPLGIPQIGNRLLPMGGHQHP